MSCGSLHICCNKGEKETKLCLDFRPLCSRKGTLNYFKIKVNVAWNWSNALKMLRLLCSQLFKTSWYWSWYLFILRKIISKTKEIGARERVKFTYDAVEFLAENRILSSWNMHQFVTQDPILPHFPQSALLDSTSFMKPSWCTSYELFDYHHHSLSSPKTSTEWCNEQRFSSLQG